MAMELVDLLTEVTEFLDNYVDVNDGDDGQPVPNRAMQLHSACEEMLVKLKMQAAANSPTGINHGMVLRVAGIVIGALAATSLFIATTIYLIGTGRWLAFGAVICAMVYLIALAVAYMDKKGWL